MVYRLGFVMEQTLGQVTHTKNFQQWVATDPTVDATWMPILYDSTDGWSSVPVLSQNWTLRASLQARDQVRAVLREKAFDALFFHTQVTALFAHGIMAKIPTVVSMDATPLNFDTIGAPYRHAPSFMPIESIKNALTKRSFSRARALVVWHEWGKQSLIADYGAPAEKVSVIPPGIDLDRWQFHRPVSPPGEPVRLLFVGGDFKRKGGDVLMAAMRNGLANHCRLDIVTRDLVNTAGLPNVRVHRGLGPNAPELMALFGGADIFVFPTLADVLPLAIMEAMSSGLSIVTTDVGAIREEIDHEVTGLLIPPNDVGALQDATMRLVVDVELRCAMGAAGRAAAERRFNGALNYSRILEILKRCADRGREARG